MKKTRTQPSRSIQPIQLTGGKKWVFRSLMVLVPIGFFLLLESGLRTMNYGEDLPLFIQAPHHAGYRIQNPIVSRRYFLSQPSIPRSSLDFFKAEKNANTVRIFVQGGSTAAGFPFHNGAAFSRMLQQQLQHSFPDREIEIVNTALAAVNSYTLLDFADEIIAEAPDLILIYAGHNEYYGALGVGSAERLGVFQPLVAWYLKVRRFHTVQLVRNLIVSFQKGASTNAVPNQTLMEAMVAEQSIPLGSRLYALGVTQFRRNMEALLQRYQEHGIPVFIATLAANERDHRPFISAVRAGIDEADWKPAFEAGIRAAVQGDTVLALSRLDEVLAVDSTIADVHFARAKLLDAASRYAEARQAYVAAKESDPLRFRAPEVMNVIIREAAAAHGAEVVEMQQAFRENSPAGLIGRTLMLEHLHPNLKGYRLMADVFYDVLKRLDVFGGHTEAEVRAGQYPTYSVIDSLAGMYRIQRLMGGWPFKPAGTVNRVLDTLSVETPLEELGMDLTHEVRSWENATEELLSYYGSQGDRIGVLHTARILAQAFPFNHSPHLVTGHVLVQLGRFDEALSEFETAYALEATVEAGKMVGILLLQQGEVETAIDYLERALAARPDDDEIQFRLGSGYMMNRQFDEARRTIQRLLERNPDHQGGRNLLTVLPAVSG